MDLEESIAADERAMDKIASALTRIAIVMEARLEKEFPPKREPREAKITYIPTEEEELQQSQGSTGESLDDWVGLREQQVIHDELNARSQKPSAKPRGSSKRIPPQSPKGKRG